MSEGNQDEVQDVRIDFIYEGRGKLFRSLFVIIGLIV